jgi:hypothetical protein
MASQEYKQWFSVQSAEEWTGGDIASGLQAFKEADPAPLLEKAKALARRKGWRVVDKSKVRGEDMNDYRPNMDKVIAFVARGPESEALFVAADRDQEEALAALEPQVEGATPVAMPTRVFLMKKSGRFMFTTIRLSEDEFAIFLQG